MDSPKRGVFDPANIMLNMGSTPNSFSENHVDIRLQKNRARQKITIITGLPVTIDLHKLSRAVRKKFCCGGIIVNSECGEILKLQGDYRLEMADFLINEKIVDKNNITIHEPENN